MAIDGRELAALKIRGRLNGSANVENILQSPTYQSCRYVQKESTTLDDGCFSFFFKDIIFGLLLPRLPASNVTYLCSDHQGGP
jgi:hypothetical protein